MSESASMRLAVAEIPQANPDLAPALLRLVLYKGELYRLPQVCRGVRVVSGTDWLTVAGEDLFVPQGEKVLFNSAKEGVLVSALGNVPLIVEVWEDNKSFRKLRP
jgi:hypothetical protein